MRGTSDAGNSAARNLDRTSRQAVQGRGAIDERPRHEPQYDHCRGNGARAMIRGYPRFPSVFPGETLVLHVATDRPRFRVEFYRQGARLERVDGIASKPFEGHDFPAGPTDQDWGWPGYAFAIPRSWPSGVYVAMLIEINARGGETMPDVATTFATSAKALFVVRHRGKVEPGTPLYKISWATFVAYNGTGYGSLYTESVWSREQPNPGFKVTWRRPGCGTGGLVMPGDSDDFYDTGSRRQTFEHWDAPLVSWLEKKGYRPHYCTDWELHQDPSLLEPYSLLLSVGHDEYWSDGMRDALDAHVARGGNIAFFSGNISGYRIHFVDAGTAFTCAKVTRGTKDPDDWERDHWHELRSEARLTGVATAFGGGWWDGKRDTQGYKVQHADHWIFSNTGLKEGDVFGADEDFPLIGYEVDGAVFRRKGGLAIPTGEGGTPKDFVILGLAELSGGWVTGRPGAAATMGIHVTPRGGIVFQGATTDWPIVVPRNRQVGTITRNIVEHLRWPSARVSGPLPTRGGRMVAAVGETATFHVDTGPFGSAAGLEVRWTVGGARVESNRGPIIKVMMPDKPSYVTVSAEVRRKGSIIGFGTRTLLPLSRKDALRLEVLINMREMVLAGEPSNPLVSASHDSLDRSWLLYTIRVPWIRDRAERMHAAATKLIEEGADSAQPARKVRGQRRPRTR
jgi:hypothetical protein